MHIRNPINTGNTSSNVARTTIIILELLYANADGVRKGPYYPRTPDQIMRRSVSEMLPIKKTKGLEALKNARYTAGYQNHWQMWNLSK